MSLHSVASRALSALFVVAVTLAAYVLTSAVGWSDSFDGPWLPLMIAATFGASMTDPILSKGWLPWFLDRLDVSVLLAILITWTAFVLQVVEDGWQAFDAGDVIGLTVILAAAAGRRIYSRTSQLSARNRAATLRAARTEEIRRQVREDIARLADAPRPPHRGTLGS